MCGALRRPANHHFSPCSNFPLYRYISCIRLDLVPSYHNLVLNPMVCTTFYKSQHQNISQPLCKFLSLSLVFSTSLTMVTTPRSQLPPLGCQDHQDLPDNLNLSPLCVCSCWLEHTMVHPHVTWIVAVLAVAKVKKMTFNIYKNKPALIQKV